MWAFPHQKDILIASFGQKKDFPESTQVTQTFDVPSHGVIVLKITGKSQDNIVFQFAKDHPMVNNPKFK
jgi:hypothetical protein